jgi:hypothetical protein
MVLKILINNEMELFDSHLGTVRNILSFQTSNASGKLLLGMKFPSRIAVCLASSDGHENSNSRHAYFSTRMLAFAMEMQTRIKLKTFIFTGSTQTVGNFISR